MKQMLLSLCIRVIAIFIVIVFLLNPLHTSLLVIIASTSYLIYKNITYRKSTYYEITGNSYSKVRFDKGLYGEYLLYEQLSYLERKEAKFLFNVYLPREENKTTEIDILIISKKGIFVLESKNYSGWIYGDENSYQWRQTFKNGKKESFYNPIMQNRTHIRFLNEVIGKELPTYSIIAFSDRCTLKNIHITSNVKVENRRNVSKLIDNIIKSESFDLLSNFEIQDIYNKLYPYTQVTAEIKNKHINNINNSIKR